MSKAPSTNPASIARSRAMRAGKLAKRLLREENPHAEKKAMLIAKQKRKRFAQALANARTEQEKEYLQRVDMLNRSPLARHFGIFDDLGHWAP